MVSPMVVTRLKGDTNGCDTEASESHAMAAVGTELKRETVPTSPASRSKLSKSAKSEAIGKPRTSGKTARRGSKQREPRKNTTPLACFFCRGRKIRCGGPDEEAGGACQ